MSNSIANAARTLALICGVLAATTVNSARGDILVADHLDGGVFRVNQHTGALVGGQPFATGVSGAQGEAVAYGPDGNLYATYALPDGTSEIRRYNPNTGAQIGDAPFIAPGAGGLHYPGDMRWGPDGNLYVANYGDFIPGEEGLQQIPGNSVIKYNSAGEYQATFDFGAFTSPSGMTIDRATGDMFVTNWYSNQLMKMNIYSDAAPVQLYQGGLLANPSGVTIGPDGNLYVANMDYFITNGTGWVQSFEPDGTPIARLADMPLSSFPAGVLFTNEGQMIVSSLTYGALYAYDSENNAWNFFADVTGGNPGTVNPALMALSPIAGDANADGIVNIADITLVAEQWNSVGPTGDVNASGKVNIGDITLIAENWLQTTYSAMGGGGGSVGLAAVPEPSTLALAFLALACSAWHGARKRRNASV